VPFAQRGRVALELAYGLIAENLRSDNSDFESRAVAMVDAVIPIARASFFEVRAPLSLVRAFGSPSFGLHHVAEVGEGTWVTAGGAISFPFTTEDYEFRELAYLRAFWDAQYFSGPLLPFAAKIGVEHHSGIFGFRLELQPALWILIGDAHEQVGGAFAHAIELQLGHEVGGGLRLQGVAASSAGARGDLLEDDPYQLALQPFFTLHRDEASLRFGLLLPLDEALGPPFERSGTLLLETAVHLD
jgi:hypothetical protein